MEVTNDYMKEGRLSTDFLFRRVSQADDFSPVISIIVEGSYLKRYCLDQRTLFKDLIKPASALLY